MDGVGVAFAATSAVLALYWKCKNSSSNLRHLSQDLKSFHDALVLTGHYLAHLDGIRAACKELTSDIEKLLSQHKSRNIIRRGKVALEDLEPLRTRLTFQITVLTLCVKWVHSSLLNIWFQYLV